MEQKNHEPGDDFMCHMCVQNMLTRRARKARRREQEKEERKQLMIENSVTEECEEVRFFIFYHRMWSLVYRTESLTLGRNLTFKLNLAKCLSI